MTLVKRLLIFLGGIALLVILALVQFGCSALTRKPPPPPPIAAADPISCLNVSTNLSPRSIQLNPELPYVPNQLLLAGEPDSIEALINDERVGRLELRPVSIVGGPNDVVQERRDDVIQRPADVLQFDSLQFVPEPFPPQAVILYEIGSGVTVVEAVALINDVLVSLNRGGTPVAAFPSPNYLMANPWVVDAVPWVVDAVPWVVDAVPWVVDAVPWVVDAVPWVVDAVPWNSGINPRSVLQPEIPQESTAATWQQWALIGEASIDLYMPEGPARTVSQDGDDVDVIIFDTSPFDKSVVVSTENLIGRELCVYHPALAIDPAVEHGNTAEHGFFAAGLSRLVAPNSHHHLVRVLNEDGVGDLFSFIAVVDAFGDARGGWQGAVVNLSMNVRQPLPGEEGPLGLTPEEIEDLKAVLDPIYHSLLEDSGTIGLEIALIEVVQQGGVIVASAGNGSDLPQHLDEPTGVPAAWDFTIAAAGTNPGRTRSCFSNRPEAAAALYAPAGDGAGRPGACDFPFPDQTVEPDYRCPAVASFYDCKFAVTSVVSKVNVDGTPQFNHWMGTSFAAPLTSGTAALMLAEAGDLSCALTPLDIRSAIVKSTNSGLISVPAALAEIASLCP